MLTCLLILATLLQPQDEGAQAPSEVRSLLADTKDRLYDPQRAGLESLSFEVPLRIPIAADQPQVEIARMHVLWTTARAEPEVDVTLSDTLPPQIADQAEVLRAQLPQQARQFIDVILNQPFGDLTDVTRPTLERDPDGLATVRFVPLPEIPIPEVVWQFDEADLPHASTVSMQQEGPGGPASVTLTSTHTWRAASPERPMLVLDSLTQILDRGAFGTQTTETNFRYVGVGDLVLLAGYTETTRQLGMSFTTEVPFESMVVNGEPVPATVPEAGPPSGR